MLVLPVKYSSKYTIGIVYYDIAKLIYHNKYNNIVKTKIRCILFTSYSQIKPLKRTHGPINFFVSLSLFMLILFVYFKVSYSVAMAVLQNVLRHISTTSKESWFLPFCFMKIECAQHVDSCQLRDLTLTPLLA